MVVKPVHEPLGLLYLSFLSCDFTLLHTAILLALLQLAVNLGFYLIDYGTHPATSSQQLVWEFHF